METKMDTKEKIILTTLELASKNGLSSVTLSQIAEKLGISKPAIYKHFSSKDDIITKMYEYLREKSKQQLSLTELNFSEFIEGRSAFFALSALVSNYAKMTLESDMLAFYKVIYAQRACDEAAAKIMLEETRRMIIATKSLFYALQAHEKLYLDDVDVAATSFALTVHAMIDMRVDAETCGQTISGKMLTDYIHWFTDRFGGVCY